MRSNPWLPKLSFELIRTSPPQVLESMGSLGTEIESESGAIASVPTRISPNRESCWDGPATPKGWPPSVTRPMLMFA